MIAGSGMLSDMETSRAFKSLAQWSICVLAVPLLTSTLVNSVQAQSSQRPFWTEQAMFRFGGELYFVGVASCASTAEEGRTSAFDAAINELRRYAQDRDTSRLLVDTQMIYEEPNSPGCRQGSTSVWRLLRVDQSILTHLPRQPREEARGPSSSSFPSDLPPAPQRQEPLVQDLTPQLGTSRADIVQRFGTPRNIKKRGREEVWEYSDIGLTITFTPKETHIHWKYDGARTPVVPSSTPPQMTLHKESEIASPQPSAIEEVTPPPLVFPKNPITDGRNLFNGKGGCNTCHGRDGDMYTDIKQDLLFGSPPGYAPSPFTAFAGPFVRRVPPNLRDWSVLKRRTDLEMARAIKDGIAGTTMTATRHLNDEEISALVSYLNSLR